MKLALCIVVLLSFGCLAAGEQARYDNYRIYRLSIENVQQLELLQEVERYPDGYRFYEAPANIQSSVNLMVPPHKFAEFSELTQALAIKHELTVADIQKQIDEEQPKIMPRADYGWTAYYRLANIYAYLDKVLAENPEVTTSLIGGTSYENREIRGVKVSYKAGNPGVFIEANIHAREWVTSATATYLLNELLTSTNPDIRRIAEDYDWYIFPVTNPDGYEYSHTSDRQWRKTRSVQNFLCRGADPNRNWGYNFMQGGASSQPCSDTFAGPSAFSEIETRSLSDFYKTLSGVSTYISFHSYSQLLLFPYGHTTAHLGNYDDLLSIATKAIRKLSERYGTNYRTGNIAEAIYIASGGSIDWAAGDQGTKIAYTYEFRDEGRYGFALPANQIIPNAQEVIDSLIVILDEARNLGYH